MEPVTVQLDNPIRDFGKTLDSVTIGRRMNVGDLRAIDGKGDIDQVAILVERLCGLSPQAVNSMDAGDFEKVAEALVPFGANSRATGGNA